MAAGREPLARQVGELRKAGFDAWGWLPDTADADHLASYVADQGADLVLLSVEDSDLIADLRDAAAHETVGQPPRRPLIEAVPA